MVDGAGTVREGDVGNEVIGKKDKIGNFDCGKGRLPGRVCILEAAAGCHPVPWPIFKFCLFGRLATSWGDCPFSWPVRADVEECGISIDIFPQIVLLHACVFEDVFFDDFFLVLKSRFGQLSCSKTWNSLPRMRIDDQCTFLSILGAVKIAHFPLGWVL